MKANFKLISMILIIILICILIGIIINYYNTPLKVSNTKINIANSGDTLKTNHYTSIIVNEKNSGEKIETIMDESGEVISNSLISEVDNNKAKKSEDKSRQVIITSEGAISNREKREILNELDDTLMDLLDAVDKVQTVDESRLITEEGEVQK